MKHGRLRLLVVLAWMAVASPSLAQPVPNIVPVVPTQTAAPFPSFGTLHVQADRFD